MCFEQVRRVCAIVLRAWKDDPDLVRVLVREVARSPQIQREIAEIEQAFAALERVVERGQAEGAFTRGLATWMVALMLYGAVEEVLTLATAPVKRIEDMKLGEHSHRTFPKGLAYRKGSATEKREAAKAGETKEEGERGGIASRAAPTTVHW